MLTINEDEVLFLSFYSLFFWIKMKKGKKIIESI